MHKYGLVSDIIYRSSASRIKGEIGVKMDKLKDQNCSLHKTEHELDFGR